MPRSWKRWTRDEDALLLKLKDEGLLRAEIVKRLDGRTILGIDERYKTLRLRRGEKVRGARNIKLSKVVRTESDNESFTLDDDTTLQSNKSGQKVEIPREFTLSIPIYFGESSIDMKAFLRWKLDQQEGMKLGIKMWRPEHVRQAMFKQIVTGAAERTTLAAVYGKVG